MKDFFQSFEETSPDVDVNVKGGSDWVCFGGNLVVCDEIEFGDVDVS